MALEISDFNGTVTAPSSTYPHGNIKNNPSGTIIDVTSNGDLQQTAQEAMLQGGITPNNLPDNADNGYQVLQGLAKISSNMAASVIISLLGAGYDPATFYILSGSATRSNDGVGFFGGQIYEIHGNPGPLCGGGLVDVLVISTTEMANGMMVANVECAASGSGAADFADVVYISLIAGQVATALAGSTLYFSRDQNLSYTTATSPTNTVALSATNARAGATIKLFVPLGAGGDTISFTVPVGGAQFLLTGSLTMASGLAFYLEITYFGLIAAAHTFTIKAYNL